jgi:hypothetical protein
VSAWSDRASRWRTTIGHDTKLTAFFSVDQGWARSLAFAEIDQSIAIVVEAAQNLNRANFPLKSKAKKFDGLTVGLSPSAENFCVYKSVRYDALRESSGNDFGPSGGIPGYPWKRHKH